MKWIDVNNKLPEVDKEILFTDGEFICKGFYGYSTKCDSEKEGPGFIDRESWDSGTGFEYYDIPVTHWMNLPKLPDS